MRRRRDKRGRETTAEVGKESRGGRWEEKRGRRRGRGKGRGEAKTTERRGEEESRGKYGRGE